MENPYVCENFDELPEADVVVVLGGILSGSSREPTGFNVGSAADRILAGLELIRLGKAEHLIVGGGSFGPSAKRESEYTVLKPWIESWELVDVPVSHLGILANTYEEADKVASMMEGKKWETVILVTSASHMRRAEAVFRTAGVKVIPVGCDFRGNYYNPAASFGESYRFVPQSHQLQKLSLYLHEQIGWVYYRARGWIKPSN
ncbi:YdcF family protein [Verrucomicrobia bacterium]|nr:YdcF family protein [Verrucomicrobiota bacterium]